MATVSDALAIAIQHHQAGQFDVAEPIYRQILAVDPDHVDALHLLGVVAFQIGNHEVAVEYIGRAIELNGTEAAFHSNLGNAFHALGKLDKAIACFCRALELKPDYAEAQNNLGTAYQAQGNLAEAVTAYRRAVELEPRNAETRNNLGNALQAHSKLDEAIDSYCKALVLKPDLAEGHFGLGSAFQAQRKLDEAVACFRRTLELKPESVQVLSKLGTVLRQQSRLDEAVACFLRAQQLNPDDAETHVNLGIAFQDKEQPDEAVYYYRKAVELKPDFVEAHFNLGVAFQDQGKFDAAICSYCRALELKPENSVAHNNLGNAFHAQRKLAEAIESYRRAIKLKPDFAEAQSNLGAALLAQGKLDEAFVCCRRALELKPDYAEAHSNLGSVLNDLGKLDEAVASARRALQLKPNFVEAHSNLGNVLKDQGKLDEALASYSHALQLRPDNLAAHHNRLYTLWFCPSYDSATIYQEHDRWNRQWAEPLAKDIIAHTNDATPNRRLRIGYVSPDFRDHCQSLFTIPLFSALDHRQFEIVCYSDVATPDHLTARLRSCVDQWKDIVGQTDEGIARLVRQDQIDILVDLTMHMECGHLLTFARKPAPVQVCWLAYPGTTGLKTIDYRLTDPYLDPPRLNDSYYSEQSIHLPDCFWCYDPLTDQPAVNSLPALTRGYVTFGCLNNFCKVNAAVLKLWARVLNTVERSRLLLLAPEGSARQSVLEVLGPAGISADRIAFVARQPRPGYLELYNQIDIGLDTFPYNGHTTSLDSFWMGVPVVTLVGQTVVGRAGLCLLHNLDLPELVAHTPDQFVEISCRLANDLPRLAQLRASMRETMEKSPLMDAPRFARNLEAAYRSMWQAWCAERRGSPSA